MRITEQGEKQRLDGLSFASSFPEDFLPYTSSYHRKAPYLVWNDNNTTHRKCKRRKISKLCSKRCRCSCTTATIAVVVTVGLVILLGAVSMSAYLGWLTHMYNPTGISLSGKLRVTEGDRFSNSLLNTSSSDFKLKAAKYEEMLQSVYFTSNLKNVLTKIEVYAFSEGSLEVYFHLHLQNIKKEQNVNVLTTTAREILLQETQQSKSAVFKGIHIDNLSIQIFDPNQHVQEESKAVTSAVKFNSTPSALEAKASHNTSDTLATATPSSYNLQSHHSHQISNSTFMFNYGQWRPLMSTNHPKVTDKIITPPSILFHSLYDPRKRVLHTSTLQPNTKDESEMEESVAPEKPKTVTTKSEVAEPLDHSGIFLQSPSIRLLRKNSTSVNSDSEFRNHFKHPKNKDITNDSITPQDANHSSQTAISDSKNLTTIELSVPLFVRGSSNGNTTDKLDTVTKQENASAKLNVPITASSPVLYLKNKTHNSDLHLLSKIPFQVSHHSNKSSDIHELTEKNRFSKEISTFPSSSIVDKKSNNSSADITFTAAASIFIRNSKNINKTQRRENLPFTGIKSSNQSATNNKTITSIFQEPVSTASIFIRGSNKGTAYIPLPVVNSEHNNGTEIITKPLNKVNSQLPNDRRFLSVGENTRMSKNFRLNNSSPTLEQIPMGKVISQYIPSKREEGKLDVRDKTKDYHQSLPNKPHRPNYPSVEKPKKSYTTSVEDLTTATYVSSTIPENNNDIQDDTHTTVKLQSISTKAVPWNEVTPTESTQDFNLSKKECVPTLEFTCSNGSCIPLSKICDRRKDCFDGTDEENCTCSDYMQSRIFKSKLCDGIVDCWDFSDEINCAWCSAEQFICPGVKQCYPQQKVCDGYPDCPGGEDELNCVKLINTTDESMQPTYNNIGHVSVRKDGRWGKLCIQNSPVSLEDIGKAICNSLSYGGLVFAKKTTDAQNSSPSKRTFFQFGSNLKSSLNQLHGPSLLSPTDCPSQEVLHVACKSLDCGLQPLSSTFRRRIVGGFGSSFGSWPWQVALYKEGDFQCGAVIINENWLISAGHCFYHSREAHWTARLGLLRRGSEIPSPYEQIHNISHVYLHPLYVDRGFINDLALLKVEQKIMFSDQVRPICLPENADFKSWEGQMCTVIGWGKLFEVGRIFPDTLQEVQLPLISTEECRKRTLFLPLYKITDNMFCAGFERGGRDACLGDSGGPFMCQKPDGKWTLVGVTSNGDGCGRPGRPGVYTKIANYLDWIQSIIGNSVQPNEKMNLCHGHRCPLGQCLPKEKVCDGIMDCWGDSDEKNCPSRQ